MQRMNEWMDLGTDNMELLICLLDDCVYEQVNIWINELKNEGEVGKMNECMDEWMNE